MSQFLRPTFNVTDWKSSGAVANIDREGKTGWGWLDYVKTQSDTYTEDSWTGPTYNDWLSCTNFGFTTNDIPSGAAIVGIEVEMDRYASSANAVNDDALYLRKSVGQVGDDKASATFWATSDTNTYVSYGGSVDDWNAGLTDTDIRASTFGIDFSAYNSDGSSRDAYIDHIRIRVYYADIQSGGWEAEPDDGVLWNKMDEVTPNDADYAWHNAIEPTEYMHIRLSNPSATPGGGVHTMRLRGAKIDGAKNIRLYFSLRQNSSPPAIAQRFIDLTTDFTTYSFEISETDIGEINDYNDLFYGIGCSTITGGGKSSDPAISWLEFEVPDGGEAVYVPKVIMIT